MELLMACLLLIGFYYLSKEAAITSSPLVYEKKETKQEELCTGQKIMIDPGHGGMDPGMIGIEGREEKKVNLEISIKLKELLEKCGYTVVLTRDSDKGLYDENARNKKAQDMQKRIALIAEEQPALTVSIHQNSYEESSVCGPQVFYYEDSVNGERLAESVQKYMNAIPGVLKRRESKGNKSYYLLKRSPSVLIIVECGFLTNPEEATLLENEIYQELVAQAIKNGIREYLGGDETEKQAIT